MVFEGDSLKDYRLDFKDNRLVKVELPSVEERKVGKLEKIEQIVNNYDGSVPSMIKQFSEIQNVLE